MQKDLSELSTKAMSIYLIFAILFVLLLLFAILPAIQDMSTDGGRNTCLGNLASIDKGFRDYRKLHQHLPDAVNSDGIGIALHSWRVAVLPFLYFPHEYKNDEKLTADYHFDEPWNGPRNSLLHSRKIQKFRCSKDIAPEVNTSYVAIVGENSFFSRNDVGEVDLADGGASTIMITETHNSGIHWMEPRDLAIKDAARPINSKGVPCISSAHPVSRTNAQGACVLFADGHYGFINQNISPKILRALLEINSPDKPAGSFQTMPMKTGTF